MESSWTMQIQVRQGIFLLGILVPYGIGTLNAFDTEKQTT